jgi:galactokinase
MLPLADFLADPDALTRQAAGALAETFGLDAAAPAVGVYVPGRVEFLGKHTDYAGGRSLLMAVERGFRLLAAGRDDNVLRVSAAAADDVREFAFGQTPAHDPGHWVNYVATVARRVAMNFSASLALRGADIAFVSDLPIAAGMSSSSALMVATFLAVSAVNQLDQTPAYLAEIDSPVRLAEYLGCVENGQSFGSLSGEAGVGTFGGSEDHTSMLCCKADMLSQFSFAPSLFERDIPFPPAMELVIACSGAEAAKTGAAREKYNRASIRARKATQAYNRATGADCRHLRDIVARVGPDGLMQALQAIRKGTLGEDADEDLPGRFEQFFREDQEIIPAVANALAAGRGDAIGTLVDASHAAAARGLQNQVEETNFLQHSARQGGALAATYFGAGFGGSVWAMVEKGRAESFTDAWRAAYLKEFPARADRAELFTTRPGRPAEVRAD